MGEEKSAILGLKALIDKPKINGSSKMMPTILNNSPKI